MWSREPAVFLLFEVACWCFALWVSAVSGQSLSPGTTAHNGLCGGGFYNLSSVENADDLTFTIPSGQSFYLRPCGQVVTSACGDAVNASICQTTMGGSYVLAYYTAAASTSVQWVYNALGSVSELTADGTYCPAVSANRATNVTYVCDLNATTPTIRSEREATTCNYTFVVATSAVCGLPIPIQSISSSERHASTASSSPSSLSAVLALPSSAPHSSTTSSSSAYRSAASSLTSSVSRESSSSIGSSKSTSAPPQVMSSSSPDAALPGCATFPQAAAVPSTAHCGTNITVPLQPNVLYHGNLTIGVTINGIGPDADETKEVWVVSQVEGAAATQVGYYNFVQGSPSLTWALNVSTNTSRACASAVNWTLAVLCTDVYGPSTLAVFDLTVTNISLSAGYLPPCTTPPTCVVPSSSPSAPLPVPSSAARSSTAPASSSAQHSTTTSSSSVSAASTSRTSSTPLRLSSSYRSSSMAASSSSSSASVPSSSSSRSASRASSISASTMSSTKPAVGSTASARAPVPPPSTEYLVTCTYGLYIIGYGSRCDLFGQVVLDSQTLAVANLTAEGVGGVIAVSLTFEGFNVTVSASGDVDVGSPPIGAATFSTALCTGCQPIDCDIGYLSEIGYEGTSSIVPTAQPLPARVGFSCDTPALPTTLPSPSSLSSPSSPSAAPRRSSSTSSSWSSSTPSSIAHSSSISTMATLTSPSPSPSPMCTPPELVVMFDTTISFPGLFAAGVVWSATAALLAGETYSLLVTLSWDNVGHPVTAGTCSCTRNFTGQSAQSCGSLTSTWDVSSGQNSFSELVLSNSSTDSLVGVQWSIQVSCYHNFTSEAASFFSMYLYMNTILPGSLDYPMCTSPSLPSASSGVSPPTPAASSTPFIASTSVSLSTFSPSLCIPPFPMVAIENTFNAFPLPFAAGVVWSDSATLLAGVSYTLSLELGWEDGPGHPISTGACSCSYNFTGQGKQSCGSITSVDPSDGVLGDSTTFMGTVLYSNSSTSFAGVQFSIQVSCDYSYDGQHGFQTWSITLYGLTMDPPFPDVPACVTAPSLSLSSSPSSVSPPTPAASSASAVSSPLPTSASMSTGPASAYSDPRFVGFYGQSFYVSGVAGRVYNLLSDDSVMVNAYFVQLEHIRCPEVNGAPMTHCFDHPGTYFGVIGIVTRDGGQLRITAGEVHEGFHGLALNDFSLLSAENASAVPDGEVAVSASHSSSPSIQVRLVSPRSVMVSAGLYRILIENVDLYVDVSEVTVTSWDRLVNEVRPDGLIGHTWNCSVMAVHDGDDVERFREQDQNLMGCNTDTDRFCHRPRVE